MMMAGKTPDVADVDGDFPRRCLDRDVPIEQAISRSAIKPPDRPLPATGNAPSCFALTSLTSNDCAAVTFPGRPIKFPEQLSGSPVARHAFAPRWEEWN
jgi:hypothetical protein